GEASPRLTPPEKFSDSLLVQQTLLQAYEGFPALRQREPEVLMPWLRQILARTLADAVKYYTRDKRDVGREWPLEGQLEQSASGLASGLAADHTSPSGRAERNEEVLRLAGALAELPELMREVVVLKHCHGWTIRQIAAHTGKSTASAASLLRRGLAMLRQNLE